MELTEKMVYDYLEIKNINEQTEKVVGVCISASCDFIKNYCNLKSQQEVINDDLLKGVLLRLAYTFYHNRNIESKDTIKIDELTKMMLDSKKKWSL